MHAYLVVSFNETMAYAFIYRNKTKKHNKQKKKPKLFLLITSGPLPRI